MTLYTVLKRIAQRGKRKRWYQSCAWLPDTDKWCVVQTADFPDYEAVVLRDVGLLSAVYPVRVEFKGWVNGLYVVGYRVSDWFQTPTHERLRRLEAALSERGECLND